MSDPAQVTDIGYRVTDPRDTPGGKIPRAEMGQGADKIVISGQAGPDPSCGIWFGGPGSNEQLGYMLTDAGTAGFKVGPPQRLGDGTMILKVARTKTLAPPAHNAMAVIVADAGGEFGSSPAATIIFLK